MHLGHATTHPTHRTAGAPEPTDPLPTRRETAARAAAPTSAGPAAFLFPKTNATAPVRCAAIRSRRIEEVPADGAGGGGLRFDVDDVLSLPTSASTLGPWSPLHGREG